MKGFRMLAMALAITGATSSGALAVNAATASADVAVETDPARCALALCVYDGKLSGDAHLRCVQDYLSKGNEACAELAARQTDDADVVPVKTECAREDWRCRLSGRPPVPLLQPRECCNNTGVIVGIGVPVVPSFVGVMPAGD